jgi:hypothetical protein
MPSPRSTLPNSLSFGFSSTTCNFTPAWKTQSFGN